MRNFIIKLLGGTPAPRILNGNEFSENTVNRTIDDITIQVINSRDGKVIAISAWTPEIAINLYKQVEDYTNALPDKKQIGVT